mgnify:CR=1 FL=1
MCRQGRSRPFCPYHFNSRRRNLRRSGGGGSFVFWGAVLGRLDEEDDSMIAARHYNRYVKIYTRTGDFGETGLLGGQRVSKAEPRVQAYGEVDELNACLGLALGVGLDSDLGDMVLQIQRELFSLGALLADPNVRAVDHGEVTVNETAVRRLEEWIDRLEGELTPLSQFILPGGCRGAATLHLARAVCRRAERRMVGLGADVVGTELLVYVNRLSDWLFVVSRVANARAGFKEEVW